MKTVLTTIFAAALVALVPAAQAQEGKAEAGQGKAAMCIGCHGIPGYQASFPEVHKVPMIAGQNAKFIVSALTAYKKGERRHPTMRGIAESLSDQDMADLAAFYSTLAGPLEVPGEVPAAAGNVAELLKKGNCASCHGANFSKPIDGSYPKLAGQHADYLFVALKAYKTENNSSVGRGNAIMGAQVKAFSNAELKELAAYLGTLPSELRTVPQSRFR